MQTPAKLSLRTFRIILCIGTCVILAPKGIRLTRTHTSSKAPRPSCLPFRGGQPSRPIPLLPLHHKVLLSFCVSLQFIESSHSHSPSRDSPSIEFAVTTPLLSTHTHHTHQETHRKTRHTHERPSRPEKKERTKQTQTPISHPNRSNDDSISII